MRDHVFQYTRDEIPPEISLEKIERLDLDELFDALNFPIIWCYDAYLQAWLPAEYDCLTEESDPEMLGLIEPQGRIGWLELMEKMKTEKVIKIPQFLPREYALNLGEYYHRSVALQKRIPELPEMSRTTILNHAIIRVLHAQIENMVNYLVYPDYVKTSYAFSASYDEGHGLPAHRDRPQCLYNISLLFSGEPSYAPLSDWPLFVEVEGVKHEIRLEPGDACLYSGTRDLHWRDKMPPPLTQVTGTFLHFVSRGYSGPLE